ncbi:MAG: CHASE3 domain-containing protein, partial [Actinomycetota bacterium]|nr:CHASE3 domain-containing protein [Actinomycetota bacterium]
MRSPSLSTRMIAASVVLALLVTGVFAVLAHAVTTLDDAREREAHSKDVTARTVTLEKLVIDLETGLRGFVLSGNPRFLQPWERARRELPSRVKELERLVSDTPAQRGRVRELRLAIDDYLRGYSIPLVRLARENRALLASDLATEEAQRRTAEVRRRIGNILEAANARAAASAMSAETQSTRAIRLGIAGLVVCALLIVLFGLYLARSTAQPVRAVATAATRLAGGDLAVRLPERGP